MRSASSNRLVGETSPYLLQHADNPVDWYPWGEEALELARGQDKPILLSIGYSACHWCHVMAHESFEDPETAAVMNRLFVNIKVDREERPDLDQIYQTAHSLLTRRGGGWPLTMFLTPDQYPFFGGTYFPKTARFGLPGFMVLLEQIATAYQEQRGQIGEQNASLSEALQKTRPAASVQPVSLTDSSIGMAITELVASFDSRYGGFGSAPKFPHPAELEFCLNFSERAPELREHALLTLEKMAGGGIYDHLGGGFCRYSVDESWMIPHFEKMLYDNGPLLGLYADAWHKSANPDFKRVAEETAQWAMGEMQSPAGGYFSSLDADSEGEEGRFYVWTRERVCQLLNAKEFALLSAYYGLDGEPNFEQTHWHLYVSKPLVDTASRLGLTQNQARQMLEQARAKLRADREQRVRPACDDKILVSWNALMIRGMARAARRLGRGDWLDSARRAVAFISGYMFDDDRLLATCKDGRAHLNAYLDDHAYLVLALLELMQTGFRVADLALARRLCDALLDRFEDTETGGFFFVPHEHERLILKPKPGHDNATPSGNAVAALALLRMGHLMGEARYLAAAERTLQLFAPSMAEHPAGFATMHVALAEALMPPTIVILRGRASELAKWRDELAGEADMAAMVLALETRISGLPAALDKPGPDAGVNAYLCQGVSCLEPVHKLSELRALLEAPGKPGQGR
jgi:uncharacterized protein YyaL (SSP411 family)